MIYCSTLSLRILESNPTPLSGFIRHLAIHLKKKKEAVFLSEGLCKLAVERCHGFLSVSSSVLMCFDNVVCD